MVIDVIREFYLLRIGIMVTEFSCKFFALGSKDFYEIFYNRFSTLNRKFIFSGIRKKLEQFSFFS